MVGFCHRMPHLKGALNEILGLARAQIFVPHLVMDIFKLLVPENFLHH